MKTLATDTGRIFEQVEHELTDTEAAEITTALAQQGIHVAPVVDVYRVLHLWPAAPVTTVQEVTALRAFAQVTDARIAWHQVVPS